MLHSGLVHFFLLGVDHGLLLYGSGEQSPQLARFLKLHGRELIPGLNGLHPPFGRGEQVIHAGVKVISALRVKQILKLHT